MYLRRQEPHLPSTTVLQVTGQLTIHHRAQLPDQLSRQHNPRVTHQRQPYDEGYSPFKKDRKQPQEKAEQSYHEIRKLQQISQKGRKIQDHGIQYQEKKISRQLKGRKGRLSSLEQKIQEGRKQSKQPSSQQDYQATKVLSLESLRQMGERFRKIQETCENSIGTMNHQTLYDLLDMRKQLKIQEKLFFSQLDQQLYPILEEDEKWKVEMERERKSFEMEKQEWKKEKQQLIQEMKGMMRAMIQEEEKKGRQILGEKIKQMVGMETNFELREEVEIMNDRLKKEVENEVKRHEELEEQLEVITQQVHDIMEKSKSSPPR